MFPEHPGLSSDDGFRGMFGGASDASAANIVVRYAVLEDHLSCDRTYVRLSTSLLLLHL